MKKRRVAIIGGGLTGCSLAAALHGKVAEITLFECEPRLVDGPSFYNEGRIHLGYTYGMDKTLETARLMIKTALVFERLLVRWFGSAISKVPRSSVFDYVVHRGGLMTGDEYAAHAKKVGEIIKETLKKGDTYFGVDLTKMPYQLSSSYLANHYDPDNVVAAFRTNEISIDPEAIAAIIRENTPKIPRVKVRLNTEVVTIKKDGSQYKLTIKSPDSKPTTETFDSVINASGRSLLRLDSLMGIEPPPDPLFRLKYLVRTRKKVMALPSTSIVLGMYGEVVSFKDYMTLAWYPAGRKEWYQGINPHRAEPILEKEPEASELKEEVVEGLSAIVPKLKNKSFNDSILKGNWIYAPGTSDVNNPKSKLHKRTNVGIKRVGNYFSLDPGKYTTSPFFAEELAKRF